MAGLTLTNETAEAQRAAFVASLEAAEAEGQAVGFHTIDEVQAEMNAMIQEMARLRA